MYLKHHFLNVEIEANEKYLLQETLKSSITKELTEGKYEWYKREEDGRIVEGRSNSPLFAYPT